MRLRQLALILIVLAAASPSTHARAQSFNCSLAKSADEVLICQYPDLARLDERLAGLYSELRNRLAGADRRDLEQKQAEWLETRRSCGRDRTCVEQVYLSRIQQLAVPATAPATERTTSPALEIEAIQLASNFILQAKLHNPHVFGPSETRAQLASDGAAFAADEGIGTVKIITDEPVKGLDIATAVAAADSKDCSGEFASGRVSELVDSDVVFRGFASCEDSSGTRVTQHLIVPRPAGGFVVFSLSATGKASQPPNVTESENLVTLRRAALASVAKK